MKGKHGAELLITLHGRQKGYITLDYLI